MLGETCFVEDGCVLMQPTHRVVQPVRADHHRRGHIGVVEVLAPRRDQLTITGEDDRLRSIRRHVHRDGPTTVVRQHLGDEFALHQEPGS
ncbi:hypothetical protein [Pseudonocardia sp. GCM10023141]|uniref:hypothetical protein n=1 Tax=Pseudonocardia sp. GCM10023141 TaxID=3252653 RepID=UPI003618930E